MTSNRHISDEELTSYLDGEASAKLQTEIERVIADDPSTAARLQALAIETSPIQSAFDNVLAAAPPPPSMLEVAPDQQVSTSKSFSMIAAVAAACILLLAGVLAGRFIDTPAQPGWQDYAAKYHALYVRETLAVVPADDPGLSSSLARAEQALQLKLGRKTLTSVPNLDLKRSQILGFEGRPLIQLAFLSRAGAPIALCIIPSKTTAPKSPTINRMEGLAAASWQKAGYEYLLIGGKDEALIRNAAQTFHDKL